MIFPLPSSVCAALCKEEPVVSFRRAFSITSKIGECSSEKNCYIRQPYMRHSSPARIEIVSANLTLDYLAPANVAPSVKTSKVRLIEGLCPTDAYYYSWIQTSSYLKN